MERWFGLACLEEDSLFTDNESVGPASEVSSSEAAREDAGSCDSSAASAAECDASGSEDSSTNPDDSSHGAADDAEVPQRRRRKGSKAATLSKELASGSDFAMIPY